MREGKREGGKKGEEGREGEKSGGKERRKWLAVGSWMDR